MLTRTFYTIPCTGLSLRVCLVPDGTDSQLLNREDIENVYINHEGRLVQLKDLCRVEEKLASRAGLVRHDGKNAVTMAVIKQNDAQMEDLQESIEGLVEDLRKEYPDISFDLTRDQTRLLTYSIDNLEQNLYVGAVLACLVLFLFMKDWRLPLLIIITIPLTLIVTLLSFHLLDISLNIISLSGLILGVGMIVDNSIIVTPPKSTLPIIRPARTTHGPRQTPMRSSRSI